MKRALTLVGRASVRGFSSAARPALARAVTKKKYEELPTMMGEGLEPLEEVQVGVGRGARRRRVGKREEEEGEAVALAGETREKREADAVGEADVPPSPRKRKAAARKPKPPPSPPAPSLTDPTSSLPQTTLALSIHANHALFPHCLLLTRVGQFYESYFSQAPLLARLLSIKLTSRNWGGRRVPMCGFPLSHLDRHLKVLVMREGRFVAMCEEFPREGVGEGFERRVTRVVTPGTLIDESFLNQYENNYLLAIGTTSSPSPSSSSSSPPEPEPDPDPPPATLGLAWIDISTGEFFTQPTTPPTLANDLARIAPKEVVLPSSDRGGQWEREVRAMLDELAEGEGKGRVSFVRAEVEPEGGEEVGGKSEESTESDDVPSPLPPPSPATPTPFTPSEQDAIHLLTSYLRSNLLTSMPPLPTPIRATPSGRMSIDAHTIRALEIRESSSPPSSSDPGIGISVSGSLLSAIRRTTTTSGTRLLARWLCSPSTSIPQISARQALVTLFLTRPHLRADVAALLHRIEDASRIVQKFLLGRGDAGDLVAIRDTVLVTEMVRRRLVLERVLEGGEEGGGGVGWESVQGLVERMRDLEGLAARIGRAVDEGRRVVTGGVGAGGEEGEEGEETEDVGLGEEPENTVQAPALPTEKAEAGAWTIKPEFSEELQELHAKLVRLRERKDELEAELRRNFSAPSLKLHSSYNHGLHIRIGNPRRDSGKIGTSRTAVMIGQSGSSKSFFYPAWSQLGADIADAEVAIQQAERRAFESLRSEVNSHATSLRRNARIVDELDVTIGFANAADELRLVRPIMDESTSYYVKNGRHPTVELGLLDAGRVFTPNTVSLTPTCRLHLITGPNMAGKSTLLRQTALIAILAQTGSFVPADKAEIGIVDKVFSRVGAKDDLFRDRSTFMVEMLETAEILRSATERSLVIMDEVGRGTTVADGLAIAFATINHLYSVNGCRALFATHFHELADMLGFGARDGEGAGEAGPFPHVGFFCTDVDELEDGHFAYSHRLRPGVNRDSHGLKVARLAGMPEVAMEVATDALRVLRAKRAMMGSGEELRALGQALAGRMGGDTLQS